MRKLKEKHYTGDLFHATNILYAINIFKDGGMKATHDYISFSRTPEIISSIGDKPIFLVFDGAKLSTKFKMKPFLDYEFGIQRTDEEAEEALLWPRDKLCHCLFALKYVVLNPRAINSSLLTSIDYLKREFLEPRNIPIKEVNIPFDKDSIKQSGQYNRHSGRPNAEYKRIPSLGSPHYKIKKENTMAPMNTPNTMNQTQDIEKGFQAQFPQVDPTIVKTAFDKNIQGVPKRPDGSTDWDAVVSNTKNSLGLAPQTNQKTPAGQPQGALKPSFGFQSNPVNVQESSEYDNINNIMVRQGSPYDLDTVDTATDPFQWELSSTKYLAKALIYLSNYVFEARFEVIISSSPKFPVSWGAMCKFHNINNVLRVTVKQLQADSASMRSMPDSTIIPSCCTDSLCEVMKKLMRSYYKIWDKSNFQIVLLGTDEAGKVDFLNKLRKALDAVSGLSYSEELSRELSSPVINLTRVKPQFFQILKNSAGGSIKEKKISEEDGMTTSASFSAVPENATVMGQTGKELNAQARKNLAGMKAKGFGHQLEATNLSDLVGVLTKVRRDSDTANQLAKNFAKTDHIIVDDNTKKTYSLRNLSQLKIILRLLARDKELQSLGYSQKRSGNRGYQILLNPEQKKMLMMFAGVAPGNYTSTWKDEELYLTEKIKDLLDKFSDIV